MNDRGPEADLGSLRAGCGQANSRETDHGDRQGTQGRPHAATGLPLSQQTR